MDFLLDKSLHVTGNGKFILTPVVKLESRSNATAEVKNDNKVDIKGGKSQADITVGMDVSGEVKNDFAVDTKAKLDILTNGAIHATTDTEDQAQVTITASKAVELAISSGNVDLVISVRLEMQNGKKTWKVAGTKGLVAKTILIDATTGAVVKVE